VLPAVAASCGVLPHIVAPRRQEKGKAIAGGPEIRVDVLGFHGDTSLRSTVEEAYRTAEAVSGRVGKPMMKRTQAPLATHL